ncbi:MAG: hypothetical protein R6U27_17785, partial [Desulfobacterales bacterium]
MREAIQLIRQIDPEVKIRDFLLLMASYLHSVRKDDECEDKEFNMINKERVKEEIDQMPDELVEKVFAFIN